MEQETIEKAKQLLIEADKEGIVAFARELMDRGDDPVELMSKAFVPGINAVGDLFGRGQLFLPELV